MPRFRKKPVEVEAIQWFEKEHFARLGSSGPGVDDRVDPLTGVRAQCFTDGGDTGVKFVIQTLEGPHLVSEGDWIITGVKGEKYPCKPNIFELTYEAANRAVARHAIVAVSGSTRFLAEMAIKMWELEKAGCIALGCHLLPEGYTSIPHHLAEAEGCAALMDELHLRKIEMADRLFVVNVKGYIGDSTRREIEYARKLGKPIEFMEPVTSD